MATAAEELAAVMSGSNLQTALAAARREGTPAGRAFAAALEAELQFRGLPVPAPPCPCECSRGGFCGGCGHAGCGGR